MTAQNLSTFSVNKSVHNGGKTRSTRRLTCCSISLPKPYAMALFRAEEATTAAEERMQLHASQDSTAPSAELHRATSCDFTTHAIANSVPLTIIRKNGGRTAGGPLALRLFLGSRRPALGLLRIGGIRCRDALPLRLFERLLERGIVNRVDVIRPVKFCCVRRSGRFVHDKSFSCLSPHRSLEDSTFRWLTNHHNTEGVRELGRVEQIFRITYDLVYQRDHLK
jgi:hypothetical protein